jgi:hypothetical protein
MEVKFCKVLIPYTAVRPSGRDLGVSDAPE